ncbi:large ribosomal subunit protein P2-like [Aristolochia californica]|uniref:large ribosomal subunit protein P2-like n=1 Tax=Aristolochia californica TaxID=171875 RepID=UPI0035D608D6
MKLIAAYLLSSLGGNPNPSAEDLKKILAAVGVDAEDDRIELLLNELKSKNLAEVIAAGREKLASVPAGGAAVAVTGNVGGVGAVAAAPAAAEPKKEEKVEEKEESDEDMGFSLFD